jgi:PHD and RING finger domain-containing protein 1
MSCLEEWSAKTNTCPVDRQIFKGILVRNYPDGKIIRRILVKPRPQEHRNTESSARNVMVCVLCGEREGPNRMISCRACNFFHHRECLTPPLDAIPLEEWFCPTCVAVSSSVEVF